MAIVLLPAILIILAFLFVIVVAAQGRPFIYRSERMKSPEKSFQLLKIRTMHPPNPSQREAVLGGDLARRVTRVGAFLRKTRLDELPQIFNVIRGDIRFIGPRPPLRKYVAAFPDLYEQVLADTPPGITGLATVVLHGREERLLSICRSAEETDLVYRTRCIPPKARLDLIYREKRSARLNAAILYWTVLGLAKRLTPRLGTRRKTAWPRRSRVASLRGTTG